MSLISWLLKPRKEMPKKPTKSVKIAKYRVTSHAQNRVIDRNIKKTNFAKDLLNRPNGKTPIKIDYMGRKFYHKIGKIITLKINPETNNVITLWPANEAEAKKYNLERKKGRKYVKKSKSQNTRTNKRKSTR